MDIIINNSTIIHVDEPSKSLSVSDIVFISLFCGTMAIILLICVGVYCSRSSWKQVPEDDIELQPNPDAILDSEVIIIPNGPPVYDQMTISPDNP
jgi:hypothetical protein